MRATASDFDEALLELSNPPIRVSYDPSVPFDVSDPAVVSRLFLFPPFVVPFVSPDHPPCLSQFEADKKTFDDLLAREKLVYEGIKSRTTEDERKSVSAAFVARDL